MFVATEWNKSLYKQNLFYTCVQATGPFLHIGALAAATLLSWTVAGQVARAEKASMFTCAAQNIRSCLSNVVTGRQVND